MNREFKRRPIRLKDYDYSSEGSYFATICVQDRQCLLGKITEGEMRLNDAGQMVHAIWSRLTERFLDIELDEFVIMPNHIHGIISMVGAPLVGALNLMQGHGTESSMPNGGHKARPYIGGHYSRF